MTCYGILFFIFCVINNDVVCLLKCLLFKFLFVFHFFESHTIVLVSPELSM